MGADLLGDPSVDQENVGLPGRRPVAELTPGECERFEALRVWRDRRAAEMGCKPFVIASNRDLLNVARSGAASPADLLSIAGFGSRRAERYGEEIVAVLGSVAEADFD